MFGLCASAVFGILLGLFYALQTFLIEKLWISPQQNLLLNAVMLVLIGTMILTTTHFFGQLPQNYGKIRLQLRESGTANYRFVLLQMIFPAFILISGTSLGPEATLVSSTLLYGTWLRDKLRYYDLHFNKLEQLSGWQKWRILLAVNKYVLRTPVSSPAMLDLSAKMKKFLMLLFFANGVMWFTIIFILSGEPSLIIRIGVSHWQPKAWFILLPLLFFSYFLGQIFYKLMVRIKQFIALRIQRPIFEVLLGGVAIFAAGMIAPEMLFSGQHNFHLFTTGWQSQSLPFLIMVALGKLVLLTICKQTGWLGGDIFPVLFSVTIIGFIIAHFLTNVDQIFAVVIVAIGMGTAILGSPILVGSLMGIMFAPLNLLPLVIVATALLKIWQDYLADRITVATFKDLYDKTKWSSRVDNWS